MKIYIKSSNIDSMDVFEKFDLAKTAEDLDVLEKLAKDNESSIRMAVATRAEYPQLLAQLANDEDRVVRITVAENTDDFQLMRQLVNDKDKTVRAALTRNTHLNDAYIMEQLANDKDKWVRQQFAKNKGISEITYEDSINWPTEDDWYDTADYNHEKLEDMWQTYLSGPEDNVNNEFQIFLEPSVQGDTGAMFIFDEAEPRRFNTLRIDWQEWENAELDMAASSSSAKEFEKKYRRYIKSLINKADPYEE